MEISQLALALGASLTAGLNLYITVFALGLMQRLEWILLPDSMDIVANPWVMGTAAFLFLIEFIADKVPYVDNLWDSVHTFIRIPAGAFLAASAMGSVPEEYVWVAGLLGGFVTFTSHGAKMTTRMAVNASPEPFSNSLLSFAEDALSIGLLALVSTYPYIALGVGIVLLLIACAIVFFLFKFFKNIFKRKSAEATA